MIRVGLIGCGTIARTHVPFIRSYPGSEIVGVCDSNPQYSKALAGDFRIAQVYGDVTSLLQEQRPDVVHILTPPQTHAELAVAAMEAGAHVLVEKPMAMTLNEADRMVATARRVGVHLCVNHNRLFDPAVLKAKQMIVDGVVGEVVGVEAFQGYVRIQKNNSANGGSQERSWTGDLPGGVLQNIAPHSISLLLAFLPGSQLKSLVTKRTGYFPGSPFEEVRMIFEGERGLGLLSFSLSPQPYLNFLNIYGSQASLKINLNNLTLIVYKNRRLPKLLAKGWFNVDQSLQLLTNTVKTGFEVLLGKVHYYPGMENLIHGYYRCLENGGSPPVTGEEGRAVVEILDSMCQQAPVGEPHSSVSSNDCATADLPRRR